MKETLAERNSLLGEIISKQQSAKIPAIMQSAAAAVTAVSAMAGSKPGEFSQYEIRFLLSASLLELKLVLEAAKQRLIAPPLRNMEVAAWNGLLMPKQGVWLDLLLGCRMSDAATIFEKSLGRKPVSAAETTGFLAEIIRIIAGGFMRTLRLRDESTCMPLLSRCIQTQLTGGNQPATSESRSYDITIEGKPFTLTVLCAPCERQLVDVSNVRELDVLAEPFPPKEISELPILKLGTVMNPRFVEKLHEQADLTKLDYQATVHRPSALSRYFYSL